MIRSSFASFNTARMAIQANQSALAIVGHNMSNAKTQGYTRQRLDLMSLNNKNAPSTFMSNPDAYIGYGVMITGVSQIRDPFLDTRYRIEMGNVGTYDKKAEILDRLGMVFDETGRTGLDDQFSDLVKQLKEMNNDPSSSNNGMVRSSSETLCGIFRNYSKGLSETQEYVETGLKTDVKNINTMLEQIQKLTVSIKSSQVSGNPALELEDQRNLLIDELSTYADIRVKHTTDKTITGNNVDKLTVDYITSDGTPIRLIDDTKAAGSLEVVETAGKFDLKVTDVNGSTTPAPPATTGAISSKGTLQTSLGMLNNSGEFDTPATEKGIPYYQKVLDEIARSFSEKMNSLNNITVPDPDNPPNTKPAPGSGDLFGTKDGSGIITAANITISKGWLDGTVTLQARAEPDKAPSDDNSNIMNMINLLNKKMGFNTKPALPDGTADPDNVTFFTGTFQECFTNMTGIQGMAQKSAESTLDNYISIVNQISDSKDSVSGVSIDEEAMNMMQYNSSLTAASRYMTTLDEALNTIINNMGVVGR